MNAKHGRRYHDEHIPLTNEQKDRVAQSLGLIGCAARRWPGLYADIGHEEAQASAADALISAARRWNPAIARWSTFAVTYIYGYWRKCYRDLKKARSKDRGAGLDPTWLDDIPDRSPVGDPVVLSEMQERIAEAVNALPPRQKQAAIECLLGTSTCVEVAKGRGVCRNAVHAAKVSATNILRHKLSDLDCNEDANEF